LEFAKKENYQIQEIQKQNPRIKEIHFDADTKMMGTMHQMKDGRYLVCIKGALEVVLKESDLSSSSTW